MSVQSEPILVLFDGDCSLCNGMVRFVSKRDKANTFRFQSLQIYDPDPARADSDSVQVLHAGRSFQKSEAVLKILNNLGPFWKTLAFFGRWVPVSWRNCIYDFVARNRYRWFPRQSCEWQPPGK